MITSLKPNEIFVFGSNLAGKHIGGAARQAKEKFGAQEGIGEGLTGQSYAFPTLTFDLRQRATDRLQWSVEKLYQVARANPGKQFLLTKVGCGIAGYDESYMNSLFTDPPANIVLPEDWKIKPTHTNMENNNLPTSELEMALIALRDALRDYNNALQIAGLLGNTLVTQLIDQLSNELVNDPDRQPEDNEASREKLEETNDE